MNTNYLQVVPGYPFEPKFVPASQVRKIPKGWGYELEIVNNGKYCGKILHYDKAGVGSSGHFHLHKDETFFVVNGSFRLYHFTERGNYVFLDLHQGDVVHLPAGTPHRLVPCGDHAELWEISTPHSDADVIRIQPGASQEQVPSSKSEVQSP